MSVNQHDRLFVVVVVFLRGGDNSRGQQHFPSSSFDGCQPSSHLEFFVCCMRGVTAAFLLFKLDSQFLFFSSKIFNFSFFFLSFTTGFFFSRFVCAVEDSSRGEEGGKQNVKERKGVTGTKKKKIQNIQKEEDENSDGRTDIPLLLPFGVGNRHDDKLLDDIHGNGQSRRPQRSLW